MLAIIALPRETFSQYFMIIISINVTDNSQMIVYSTPSVINNGNTNRSNGRLIVDAKIQIKSNLQLGIQSSFRNNLAIIKRTIVSIKIVIIQAIKNFTSLLAHANSIPSSLSTSSNA